MFMFGRSVSKNTPKGSSIVLGLASITGLLSACFNDQDPEISAERLYNFEKYKPVLAWHEAGHTVYALNSPLAERYEKTRIYPQIANSTNYGAVWMDFEGMILDKSNALEFIALSIAGPMSAELFYKGENDPKWGHEGDHENIYQAALTWAYNDVFGEEKKIGDTLNAEEVEKLSKIAPDLGAKLAELVGEAKEKAYATLQPNHREIEDIAIQLAFTHNYKLEMEPPS